MSRKFLTVPVTLLPFSSANTNGLFKNCVSLEFSRPALFQLAHSRSMLEWCIQKTGSLAAQGPYPCSSCCLYPRGHCHVEEICDKIADAKDKKADLIHFIAVCLVCVELFRCVSVFTNRAQADGNLTSGARTRRKVLCLYSGLHCHSCRITLRVDIRQLLQRPVA